MTKVRIATASKPPLTCIDPVEDVITIETNFVATMSTTNNKTKARPAAMFGRSPRLDVSSLVSVKVGVGAGFSVAERSWLLLADSLFIWFIRFSQLLKSGKKVKNLPRTLAQIYVSANETIAGPGSVLEKERGQHVNLVAFHGISCLPSPGRTVGPDGRLG